MSAVTPAARAIKQADKGIGGWLADLVTGAGSSPSQIIVTGILGVVPGVGQAMDARDLIMGIIVVVRSPLGIGGWIDLVITLIGCVPAIGDALKVGFKLMKQGKNFGRVLEAASPKLRGNVEKYFRNINWASLASHAKSLFTQAIDTFIDGLDNWAVKAFAGRHEVTQIIDELRAIRRQGPKMIDDALAELKAMHNKMMGHELPHNRAAAAAPAPRVTPQSTAALAERKLVEAKRIERKLAAKKATKEKPVTAQPNSTKTSKKKKAEPKKQEWSSGIPAEHISDYYVRRKHTHYRKANNYGRLIEEHSLGHNGLDHLWANSGGGRRFVVGETKSSIFDSFQLLAALPADLQEAFNVLRADEEANPTTTNRKPNIFESSGRDDHANKRLLIGSDATTEAAVRRGVNKPNPKTGLRTQMSHEWIAARILDENLTKAADSLDELVEQFLDGNARCPYNRWILLVTGRQLHKHRQSGGSTHEVQTILNLPDNILRR